MQEKEPKWITYQLISNDLTTTKSVVLLEYKEIISKALPNMDKPHIIRLLLDPRHESLLIRENEKIIGGVCYRIYPEASFAEIAFLAVRQDRRIQGFGQKMMNRLKSIFKPNAEQMQIRQIEFLLTYGDNMALGFFRKQGFSEKLTMPRKRWEGYIKQYDGGKLMECKIYPKVDYLQIHSIIKQQRQFLIQKIKSLSINSIKFNGKDIPSNQPLERKLHHNKIQVFRTDPRFIPGFLEGGWTFEQHDSLKLFEQEPLEKRCTDIVNKIKRYPESLAFRKPIPIKNAPQYHKHIKNPMDLSTIQNKIIRKQYQNQEAFCQDIELIFSNCKQFNHPQTVYYKNAAELQKLATPLLQAFKNGMINTAE